MDLGCVAAPVGWVAAPAAGCVAVAAGCVGTPVGCVTDPDGNFKEGTDAVVAGCTGEGTGPEGSDATASSVRLARAVFRVDVFFGEVGV